MINDLYKMIQHLADEDTKKLFEHNQSTMRELIKNQDIGKNLCLSDSSTDHDIDENLEQDQNKFNLTMRKKRDLEKLDAIEHKKYVFRKSLIIQKKADLSKDFADSRVNIVDGDQSCFETNS